MTDIFPFSVISLSHVQCDLSLLVFKIPRKVPVLLTASFGGLQLTCCMFIPLSDWRIKARGSKAKTVLAGVPWHLSQAIKTNQSRTPCWFCAAI